MLWTWSAADDAAWLAHRDAGSRLFAAWIRTARSTAEQEPALLGVQAAHADPDWFVRHLSAHTDTFLGSPLDVAVAEASRRIGFAHIQAQVRPSWYVGLYNLLFATYHTLETDDALVPLGLLRQRWLADVLTVLDTYAVAVDTRVHHLNELATRDPLTGLLNRPALITRIAQDVERGVPHALLVLLDLDRFKHVNDTRGHPEGDRILEDFGRHLKAIIRTTDVAGRLGGDEFVWWAPGAATPDLVATRLARLARLFHRDVGLAFSAGVARYPQHGRTFAALYAAADQALYRVKTHGRRGWVTTGEAVVHRYDPG